MTGDQVKSLVSAFWLSLLEARRLERIPGDPTPLDMISFGGADTGASVPRAELKRLLANRHLALVTRADEKLTVTNLLTRWETQLRPANGTLRHRRKFT